MPSLCSSSQAVWLDFAFIDGQSFELEIKLVIFYFLTARHFFMCDLVGFFDVFETKPFPVQRPLDIRDPVYVCVLRRPIYESVLVGSTNLRLTKNPAANAP